MNIKTLNSKSYTMLLISFICYMVSSIITMITTIILASSIETFLADMGTDAASLGATQEEFNQVLNFFKNLFIASAVISIIISALIFIYFMVRINKNRKVPQGQRYITVLQVVSILSLISSGFSVVFFANYFSFFSIAVYVLVLVACSMQKKYVPSFEEAGVYGAPPYGNPYDNQNPYGAPNGYPYQNQNPYGTPPSGDPYANQNPYGVPPSGDPYANQNPYGTPPSGDPYANQNPYGAPPSGDPYANQPTQNPNDPNNNNGN